MPSKEKSPLGFTPPSDYIIDPNNKKSTYVGISNPEGYVEIGHSINTDGYANGTTQTSLEIRRLVYDRFKDFGTEQFTHLLDFQDSYNGTKAERKIGELNSDSNAYLGSFIRTLDDNEDPTMLGFDIKILVDESPLFNGDIDEFISTLGAWNSEIASRQSILDAFRSQLFKFLKNDNPSSTNSDGTSYNPPEFIPKRAQDGNSNTGVKVYYLKKIAGLDKLTESTDGSEIKSFVDYGKDFISLTFWEDVSQNIGYLSSLYKQLWWSRINGKSIIPQNLLRFDVEITVTEVRKYNRVIKEIGKNVNTGLDNSYVLNEYADNISKYTYRLYECQFFFTGLPHGDSLDMTAPAYADSYDVKFNYKNSTMKFTKFYDPGPLSRITRDSDLSPDNIEKYYTEIDIDNSSLGRKISSINTNNSSIGPGGIQHSNNITPLDLWNIQSSGPIRTTSQGDTIESLRAADKTKTTTHESKVSKVQQSNYADDIKKALSSSIQGILDKKSKSESEGENGTFLGGGFGVNAGANQPGSGANVEIALKDSYTTLVDDRSAFYEDGTFLGQDGTGFGVNTGTNQPGSGVNVEIALKDSYTTLVDDRSAFYEDGTFLGQDGTGFGVNTGTNQPGSGVNVEIALKDSYTTLVDDRSAFYEDGTFLGQDGTGFGVNTGTNQGSNVEMALMDSFTTMSDEDSILNQNGGSLFVSGSPWDKLKREMLKEVIGIGNAAILATTALLNKALGEISITLGSDSLGMVVSPPTNVYDEYYNDGNYSDFINFVGDSVRGFFTNPSDPRLNNRL